MLICSSDPKFANDLLKHRMQISTLLLALAVTVSAAPMAVVDSEASIDIAKRTNEPPSVHIARRSDEASVDITRRANEPSVDISRHSDEATVDIAKRTNLKLPSVDIA